MAKTLLNFETLKVQNYFRTWYGTLSVLELAVNSRLTKKIQEVESLLEGLKNQSAKNNQSKLKLTKLESELGFLWEVISPSQKNRESVFKNFLELQKEVRELNERTKEN